MKHPEKIEEILQEGARKAREIALPFIDRLRQAVGLRNFAQFGQTQTKAAEKKKAALPIFKQYREDGKFFFKLVASDGCTWLQSTAFDSGKDAGLTVATLKRNGFSGTEASLGEGVNAQAVNAALEALRQAEEEKKNSK